MSHITCQAERDENAAIWACPHRSVTVWREVEDDWTGEISMEPAIENQCGDSEYISVGKDRCKRCGKVFTY